MIQVAIHLTVAMCSCASMNVMPSFVMVGWTLVRSEDGLHAYRKFMGIGPGSNYACIKCTATINSTVQQVYSLLVDDSR